MRTHFRNTFVADVALAANVNESMRYRVMERLGAGSAIGTLVKDMSSSSQTSHEAKAKNPSTNYGHDPMDLSISRPSVPALKFVSDCQPLE